MPLSPPTLSQRFARLRGSTIQYDLRRYEESLTEINRLEEELKGLEDSDLLARSRKLGAEARAGVSLDALLPRAYSLIREASRRVLGERPFDVQILAAIALYEGKVVEMQTGEGKTLAAVASAYLHALAGKGVHVLTFNDYLARRDAEWMGPIYEFLGLSASWIVEGLAPAVRRRAYLADVTYLTAKEAGFDFLRDRLATKTEGVVHRPFHYAIVDEADSLLIDEARVPLVLAGSVDRDASAAPRLAALVAQLEEGVHFIIEEFDRNVELLEAGFDLVEEELDCGSLVAEENLDLLTEVNCALHAQVLLRCDVDYIVRDGKIDLIDESTGRVAEDRQWPDGLQAALEAKEGLACRSDGCILGSITLQHYLGSYSLLCGMTGTAQDAAHELHDFYGLEVVVIPTHRKMIREDHTDVVFTHREAKEKALVQEIRRVHRTGRPVLVGTLTVAESECLAGRLKESEIDCEVLNARNDAMEAGIIAKAGCLGAITISTNMAGRGTDIRLGGEDGADYDRVVELGGLYVLGTNRNESLRIDRQLRGRAGRQGDPGESRFFLSLEDDLLERYELRSLIPPSLASSRSEEPLDHPLALLEIERIQRIIEGQNYEIRKTLWRYATPVEDQGQILHAERQALLVERAPKIWERSPRFRELLEKIGAARLREAETLVTLLSTDRVWSDHLEWVAGLREGIHLVALGGKDPLTVFRLQTAERFRSLSGEIDNKVLAALDGIEVHGEEVYLEGLGIRGPSSTWTYLINDDPFRNQLTRTLTGPGGATMAIGGALAVPALFMLWLLIVRMFRKKPLLGPEADH